MVIGLTGGIASGKSTVSKMLQEFGAVVIDADQIAREVVEPGQPVLRQIKERFGEHIVDAQGTLIRSKLAEIIFADAQARNDLNAILHPVIRRRMLQQKEEALQAGESFVVLDIPLLFESKLEHLVDKILVVYVPKHMQLERLMARDDIDQKLAQQKIDSQLPLETKKNSGHAYIDNSRTRQETEKQLKSILQQWRDEGCS